MAFAMGVRALCATTRRHARAHVKLVPLEASSACSKEASRGLPKCQGELACKNTPAPHWPHTRHLLHHVDNTIGHEATATTHRCSDRASMHVWPAPAPPLPKTIVRDRALLAPESLMG